MFGHVCFQMDYAKEATKMRGKEIYITHPSGYKETYSKETFTYFRADAPALLVAMQTLNS